MMPDMNGMEFCDALARDAPHLLQHVVFLSGGAFTPSTRQFLARMENLRLQKPFDSKALRAIVREVMDRLDARAATLAAVAGS
jgi:CheY-like chemotaxis protein